MSYVKVLKFKDRYGKKHSYAATYIDDVMIPEDWAAIQLIIKG